MTVKGITIWERYIERIVLAIAVLTLVGFTAMQFVGEPNAVTMDGRSVAPGEVDRLLEAEAQRLLVRLAPEAAPADAPWGERYFHITDPDGHELSFAKRLDNPV